MSANNEIYDDLATTWWGECGFLNAMGALLNPARVPYFSEILMERAGSSRSSASVLDVGAGGGLLAEEIARFGFTVVGIDMSQPSTVVARNHVRDSGLNVSYIVGDGRRLPFDDSSFDIVLCSDVLEHVTEWQSLIRESSRVLRHNGVLLFETLNRTPLSWLIAIKLLQHWTRILPKELHAYGQFIRPGDLQKELLANGVEVRDVAGVWPSSAPPAALATMVRLKLGRIGYREAARRLKMRCGSITALSYMGYGVRSR